MKLQRTSWLCPLASLVLFFALTHSMAIDEAPTPIGERSDGQPTAMSPTSSPSSLLPAISEKTDGQPVMPTASSHSTLPSSQTEHSESKPSVSEPASSHSSTVSVVGEKSDGQPTVAGTAISHPTLAFTVPSLSSKVSAISDVSEKVAPSASSSLYKSDQPAVNTASKHGGQASMFHGATSLLSLKPAPTGTGMLAHHTLRIMPLGASIVYGTGSKGGNGFRKYLLDELRINTTSSYIGSVHAGNMTNNNCEARPGATIQQMQELAAQSIGLHPNVVLIHVGTNNLRTNSSAADASAELASLLNWLISKEPEAVFLVAEIVSTKNKNISQHIPASHSSTSASVTSLAAQRSKVLKVSFPAFKDTDLSDDGIHPNDKGYQIMGHRIYERIRHAGMIGWITDPLPLPSSGTLATQTTSPTFSGHGPVSVSKSTAPHASATNEKATSAAANSHSSCECSFPEQGPHPLVTQSSDQSAAKAKSSSAVHSTMTVVSNTTTVMQYTTIWTTMDSAASQSGTSLMVTFPMPTEVSHSVPLHTGPSPPPVSTISDRTPTSLHSSHSLPTPLAHSSEDASTPTPATVDEPSSGQAAAEKATPSASHPLGEYGTVSADWEVSYSSMEPHSLSSSASQSSETPSSGHPVGVMGTHTVDGTEPVTTTLMPTTSFGDNVPASERAAWTSSVMASIDAQDSLTRQVVDPPAVSPFSNS